MRTIILASASPRRKYVLEHLGLDFDIHPSDLDESSANIEDPFELVRELALAKAREVVSHYNDALIIGADSVIVFEGEIIGKPKDARDARAILQRLRGKTHQGVTGMAIIDTETGREESTVTIINVLMRNASDQEIDAYIDTGEPLDKAGAYGVQGHGDIVVEKLYENISFILGLPIQPFIELIGRFGVDVPKHEVSDEILLQAP